MLFIRSLKSTRILVERQHAGHHDAHRVQRVRVFDEAAFFHDQREHVAHGVVGNVNGGLDRRFLDLRERAGIGHVDGIIDFQHGAAVFDHAIDDAGIGRNDIHIVLAANALLDDFHVQKPEKTATKAKSEGDRAFRRIHKGGIVEPQTAERSLEFFVIRSVHRIQTAKDHGPNFLVSRQHFGGRFVRERNGVARFDVGRILDARNHVTDVARAKCVHFQHLGGEHADLLHFRALAGAHEHHHVARPDGAGENAGMRDYPAIGIVDGIEHQRACLRIFGPPRRRDACHHGFENIDDADAGFATRQNRLFGRNRQNILQLTKAELEIRARQIDFVDDRNDLEVLAERQMGVGHGLRLHALGGVDQEHGAFARRKTARNFIGEVHMAGRIHEVEFIDLSVLRRITHRHRMRLDRDPTLFLEVHRVEMLGRHRPLRHGIGIFQQPVGQCGFAVIDVGNDTKIASQRNNVHGKAAQAAKSEASA